MAAARFKRIAAFALVGIADRIDRLLRVDALDNVIVPGCNLKGLVEEEAVAIQAIHNQVDGRSTSVQGRVRRARFVEHYLRHPLDFVWRGGGWLGGRLAGTAGQNGKSKHEETKNVRITAHRPCPRF